MREIQFREPSADTERIQYNTNGMKTGSSKNIDLLKAREGTAESSGATRFSKQDSATLLLTFSKSLLQMRETEHYSRQT